AWLVSPHRRVTPQGFGGTGGTAGPGTFISAGSAGFAGAPAATAFKMTFFIGCPLSVQCHRLCCSSERDLFSSLCRWTSLETTGETSPDKNRHQLGLIWGRLDFKGRNNKKCCDPDTPLHVVKSAAGIPSTSQKTNPSNSLGCRLLAQNNVSLRRTDWVANGGIADINGRVALAENVESDPKRTRETLVLEFFQSARVNSLSECKP